MKVLQFKCTLKTDVILNVKSASEGANKTLDFIPGSNFLGIVASQLYDEVGKDCATELFHSGNVRFGDAHPSIDSESDVRTVKIPTVFYYPKLGKLADECYVSYNTDMKSDSIRLKQLKQCRSGFYDFCSDKACLAQTKTGFAIKSAYDKTNRRSKDSQMYGYESLRKGLTLMFEVEVANDLFQGKDLADAITKSLVGEHRIGRSRTAQYGLVEIEATQYSECASRKSTKQVAVYADGRLIFMDKDGMPTFQPTEKQLGIDINGARINWEKSQVRTFQYSPWNFKRQCFDTDRCGLEKGSVIVVDIPDGVSFESHLRYVGSYKNEGFGKVIYNPAFLESNENGLSNLIFSANKARKKPEYNNVSTPLIKYLEVQMVAEQIDLDIYKMVNDFKRDHAKDFMGAAFASQWGQIRNIATRCHSKKEIETQLYNKIVTTIKKDKDGNDKPVTKNMGYLTHGVAETKWKGRRLDLIREFIGKLNDDNAQMAVVNLAAVMGKTK